MAELDAPSPSGAAGIPFTFLFTDIEGSTRLLQELGGAAPAVIARHHDILGEVIAQHGGAVRRTEGDSFFATFDAPVNAVHAAVELQLRLHAEPWPRADGVHVRVGLHTGNAVVVANEFVGLDVHRAARLMGIGWGDQVLASDATVRYLGHGAPECRDLGEHRLKDLAEPMRVHQVLVPGMRMEFPALRSLDAIPNNLPVQVTSFVGRSAEVAAAADLLDRTRLLTLTGPGGTGKTRLSLQVAAEVATRYPDGVFFVALASITDPRLVMSTVAETLGLSTTGTRTPLEMVIEHLADKTALLVLDNFEQILAGAIDVAKLVADAPHISVLVSSRAPLHISGEQSFPVPPLSLPGGAVVDAATMAASEAATLFVARATAVRPDFVVTDDNAAAVFMIISRLDGLPLAIELAVTRLRVLSVEAIAQRLGAALDLLSTGARDLTERQRTLRGAITWSHDLLDQEAQSLFARMAVFRGGVDFDQLEQVCSPDLGADVFDVLAVLVDHSLVRRVDTGAGSRFDMLETIREFAADRLAASHDGPAVRQRHTRAYLDLATAAAPHLLGENRAVWLDRLEADHDNLRSAIVAAAEDGDARSAMTLVVALWRMWQARGHLHEARRMVDFVIALPGAYDLPIELADVHEAGGGIAYWQGELERGRAHYEQALALYRERGDEPAIARGLYNLGFTYGPDESSETVATLEQALAAYEALGDELGVARAHWGLTVAALWAGNFDDLGRHADACIPVFRAHDQTFDLAWALHMRGLGAYGQRLFDEARVWYRESLNMFVATNDPTGYYLVLADMALLAEAEGEAERALRLFGASDRLAAETGSGLLELEMHRMPRFAFADDAVDEEIAAALRAEGRALSNEDAIAYALGG